MPRRRRKASRPAGTPPPARGFRALRPWFLTGLVILLPLVITIWLLGILVRMVEAVSTPVLLWSLRLVWPIWAEDPVVSRWMVPVLGMLITVLLVIAVGAAASNFLGRRVVDAFDRLMLRVPVVKGIYGAARQLLDAFGRTSGSFRRVVAVEYPRAGVWTIGFLTQSGASLRGEEGTDLRGVSLVFLPTTPNPTSGWLAVVPDDKVVALDVSVEDGVKLIVSGGLVLPPAGGPGG